MGFYDRSVSEALRHKVTFVLENGNRIETTGAHGEKLNQIAHRCDVVIQQTCGGSPSCADCKVKVLENLKTAFLAPESAEIALLGNIYHITHERLSCQALLGDDTSVFVPDAGKIREKHLQRSQEWQQKRKQQKNQRKK